MAAVDLPTYPNKGNRRSLDSSWLALCIETAVRYEVLDGPRFQGLWVCHRPG